LTGQLKFIKLLRQFITHDKVKPVVKQEFLSTIAKMFD